MLITLEKPRILIEPETEFERQWIDKTFGRGTCKAWVKRGLSPADVVGLVVELGKEEEAQ